MEELRMPVVNSDAEPKPFIVLGLNGRPLFIGGACNVKDLPKQFRMIKEAMK